MYSKEYGNFKVKINENEKIIIHNLITWVYLWEWFVYPSIILSPMCVCVEGGGKGSFEHSVCWALYKSSVGNYRRKKWVPL